MSEYLKALQQARAHYSRRVQGKDKRPADVITKAVADIVLYLLEQQVCPRCVLRVLGHSAYEDYRAQPPSVNDVAASLNQQPQQSSYTSDASGQALQDQPPATSAAVPEACVCTLCLGILQLVDGTLSAPQPSTEVKSAQQGEGGDGMLPDTALHSNDSSGAPVNGSAEAMRPGQAGDPAPSAALAAMQPLRMQPLAAAQPADLSAAIESQSLTFATLGIDVSTPLACVAREHMLHAHLAAHCGASLVLGQPTDIISLKPVLRRMLGLAVATTLGKQYTESQVPDVCASLVFEHPATDSVVQVLAEDNKRMQKRREQHQQAGRRGRGRGGGAGQPGAGQGTPAQEQTQEADATAHADGASAVADDSQADPGTAQQDPGQSQAMSSERMCSQLSSMPRHILAKLFPWPPQAAAAPCTVGLKLVRAPLLLTGRYLKLRRGMPQTRWINMATGVRIGGVSLAEYIEAAILPVYGAEVTKFVSGGREDADVRMLGNGRPFVLEVINPRLGHPAEEVLQQVEQALAASCVGVQVRELRPCTKQALEEIKAAEETKEKEYEALCWCSRPLTGADVEALMSVKDLDVSQDTPVRVLHRRAPKIRSKRVSVLNVTLVDGHAGHYFRLQLRTQAGTYVKEFCNGDFGRTHPSLASLLSGTGPSVRSEILQLDVVAVHMH